MYLTEENDVVRLEFLFKQLESQLWFYENIKDQLSVNEFKIQRYWASRLQTFIENKKINILNSGIGYYSVGFACDQGVKRIALYDMCPVTKGISEAINKSYKELGFEHQQLNTTFDDMLSADIWINTSCEHSYPMKDIIPKNKLCVMSGNDLTKRGHINLIHSQEELMEQTGINNIMYADTMVLSYNDDLGERDYNQHIVIGTNYGI
jgi:hypothetical protein